MSKQSISLVLLKKLVGETERILEENEAFKANNDLRVDGGNNDEYNHYVVEMAKVSGLLGSITNECKLLGGDVLASLRLALMPDRSEHDDFADLLNFNPPSGNGGSNLGN